MCLMGKVELYDYISLGSHRTGTETGIRLFRKIFRNRFMCMKA